MEPTGKTTAKNLENKCRFIHFEMNFVLVSVLVNTLSEKERQIIFPVKKANLLITLSFHFVLHHLQFPLFICV
jgi:hypothetical protein